MSEHTDQAALFEWAARNRGAYPELDLLFAIPNGAKLPYTQDQNGRRVSRQGNILKEEGLKSGVPDLFLPVARLTYHGFFIELKSGKNTTSANQDNWIEALRRQGYRVEVFYDWELAAKALHEYLSQVENCCVWKEVDPDASYWEGGCGGSFCFIDGGPSENGIHFCPRCGKKLVVAVDVLKGGEE